MADYLENMGIDKTEVDKMRKEKTDYICGLASQVQLQIKHKLREKGVNIKDGYNVEDVRQILDSGLMKNLLEVESGIMAYGFYQQTKLDKQQGLDNLKRFMKSNIPKDRAPDFTHYGLSNTTLLELSTEYKKSNDMQYQNTDSNERTQNALTNTKVKRLIKPTANNHAFIKNSFILFIIFTFSILLALIILTIKK